MNRTTRMAIAALGGPVLLGALTLVVGRSWISDLPDPVATHWGPRGVDGFTAAPAAVWMLAAITVGIGLVLGVLLWAASSKVPPLRRGAGGLAWGMSGFIAFLGLGSLWVQRGLTDARLAPNVDLVIGLGLLVGLACAAVGAWAAGGPVPGAARATLPVPAAAPRLPIRATESVAWTGWAMSLPLLLLVGSSTLAGLVVLALVGRSLVLAAVMALVLGSAMLTMGAFRVVAGAGGLRVQSVARWPRFRVPLSEVAEARTVTVRPLAEFGGWGLRAGADGRFGVILRAGEALEVVKGDGTSFLVTVDGANEAAAVLNSLAERERAGSPEPGSSLRA